MDQTARRHLARLVLMSACAALPLAGIGCEKPQREADKKANLQIAQSEVAARQEANEEKAYTLLTQAAQHPDLSDSKRSHAKTLIAQTDYAWVIKHMPELTDAETKAAELIDQISLLGQQIVANNLLIEQCKSVNPAGAAPSQPVAELTKTQAKYSTLAADLDKQILAADAKVRAKAADIDSLTKQQIAAADQAGLLLDKSEQTKGQASVDLFKQYADQRAKAENLTLSTNLAKAELAKLEVAVAELKTQKKLAADAAAASDRQAKSLAAAWTKAQAVIQATQANSKAIATGSDGVTGKGQALTAALAAADEKRKQLDARLLASINAYAEAAKASDAVNAAMLQRLRDSNKTPEPVERLAWKRLERLHNPAVHRLDKARVLTTRGAMYIAQKTLLESKLRLARNLAAAYAQAGLGAPAEFNVATIQKEVAAAADLAQACLKEADELLVDMSERGQAEDKIQADFPRIGTQYSLYCLTGKQTYLTSARDLLDKVLKAEGDEAGKSAKVLPMLPADLEAGIVKRAQIDLRSAARTTTDPATAPGGRSKEASTFEKMLKRGLQGMVPGAAGPVETPPPGGQ